MEEIKTLLKIMSDLRNPNGGCPWDIEQTFESIAAYTVEEAYEVADAVERKDIDDLKNELGDLLFQVVYHAQIAAENGAFEFADVVNAINAKLIRRHPHVFTDKQIDDKASLCYEWEKHKQVERAAKRSGDDSQQPGLLDGIIPTLPALRWSEKIQKRASQNGFDWCDLQPVLDKLQEEIAELEAETGIDDNQQRIADEMGDILFASVNLSRHLGVNPEQALRDSNRKFIARFEIVEQLLREDGRVMKSCSVADLEGYWQKAKLMMHR